MKRAGLIALVLASTVAIDLGSKLAIRLWQAQSAPLHYRVGPLRAWPAENSGTFLNVGAGLAPRTRFWLFSVGTGVVLAALLGFALARPGLRTLTVVAIALIVGGGAGNVIDRLWHDGAALDFITADVMPLHLLIFNLADVAIAAGMALLSMSWIRAFVRGRRS